MRPPAQFFPFHPCGIPCLLGWIAVLLAIEEATLGDSFLLLEGQDSLGWLYGVRVAFLLGIGLSVILHLHLSFPDFPIIGLAVSAFALSFIPLGENYVNSSRLVGALASGVGLGRFGLDFFLGFDNRQKGLSLVLAFTCASGLFLLGHYEGYISLGVIGLGLLCLLFGPFPAPKKAESLPIETVREWGLLALSFASFILNGALELSFLQGYFLALPSARYWALGGGIFGVLLALFFLKNRRLLLTYGLYLSFSLSALGGLAFFFLPNPAFGAFASFALASAHTLGLFSLYYVLGVYTKKYKNRPFYDAGAILAATAYGLALLLSLFFPFSLSAENRYWAVLFLAIPLLLFSLLPLFLQRRNSKEWLLDLHREDVSQEDALTVFFKEAKLSKREIEVARGLLKGLTLRQIAGELALSYPTVNTHQTSIYRKLGINSRAEFLLLCQPYFPRLPPH